MTYRELYNYGVEQLTAVGIEEAALDARLLLEYICHTDRNTLLVHGDSQRNAMEEEFYKAVIAKRAERIPLQHITGEQEFMGLSFRVNEHTLIPRQDTEILVEEAMRHLHDGMCILDMCTGSGCILLSLLKYSNECEGVGVDISAQALEVAGENATRLGLKADFIQSDLFEQVQGRFDMLVSNPPYIATKEIETLMPEVREHEPIQALDGMEDGLYFYRKIVEKSTDYLYNGARLYFEIGYDQGEAVSGLMRDKGFQDVKVIKDYAGLDRVVVGKWLLP
ncbi:MAG: peptide chain release factor N(5)-glutamine methyltransferase [Lachnospiraceae bacterium]|nr:peptide chain release factor N(5)-glutamine methyltransferase [Lachnospiraceae bacterium]